ncbi:hypothetical protein [Terrihabitans rhizophilus]|jgi:hypothetical protein|uniref:DUF4148 domain-containing protein n=1 Tax=Terrihabitans rhizophilus TaxID=3092662 RepID=A0ABU4RU22_9HYPH|nr:hypothetical protein [Terrihabitans sp. PJ23]MDX6807120.1 hypothetical protein [Terrihabitans sp. PJ23]
MNTIKTLILSGALALTAGAALAQQPAGATHDSQRIQEGIYAAQSNEQAAPVLREGRASAVGAAPVRQEQVREPFYFRQATSGSDRNAN